MPRSTEHDYNAAAREIEFCVDIYFDGVDNTPLHITRSNYLIDLDLLEETCSDDDTFIGAPSANEVSFNIFSDDGIFNPNNTQGPYYNKIKIGLCMKVYARPIVDEPTASHQELSQYTHEELSEYRQRDINELGTVKELDWDPLGTFFITDWSTDITGINVRITGTDTLASLFSNTQSNVPIEQQRTMEELITDFFSANNKSITITGQLDQVLSFAYINETNDKFLKNFSNGSLSFIYADHAGDIVVQPLDASVPTLWTLTDHDQILEITADQSIINTYDGVMVVCEKPQLSECVNVLSNKEQTIGNREVKALNNQGLSSTPLYALSHVEVQSMTDCDITNVEAHTHDISYKITNSLGIATTVSVNFFGYIIEKVPITLSDDTLSMLKLDSDYVQNEDYAEHLKNILTAYIRLKIPVLEVVTRGNPKYQPGDKIRIYSEAKGVDFTGWLIRQHFTYDGGLKCTITVLNSAIIGG